MNVSYIRILQAIESFSRAHMQIKRFASDFPGQMPNFATEEEEYPILWVSPLDTIFDRNANTFSVDIYCFDIIQKDRANINTILSDTNQILNDLHRWFLDGDIYGIDVEISSPATPLNNSLLDYAAGWKMTLNFIVDTYGICEIPFDEPPVVITEVNDIVYSQWLTCETLADCDTFNNAIADLQDQIDAIGPGATGPQGPTGPQGAAGVTGPQGPTGTSLLEPIFVSTYSGTRLQPIGTTYNGFSTILNKNANVGINIVNSSTGNGAISNISVSNTTADSSGLGIINFSSGYYIPYLRGKNALLGFQDTFIIGSNGSAIDIRTGTTFGGETSKLRIANNGQIQIGVEPTLDNTATSLLGRKTDGSLITLDKSTLLGEYVPYTGATGDVNLGANDLFVKKIISTDGISADDGSGASSDLSSGSIFIYPSDGGYITNFGASILSISNNVGNIAQIEPSLIQLEDASNLTQFYNTGIVKNDQITSADNTFNFPNKPAGYVGEFAMISDLEEGYVPYTGATGDVDLGEWELKAGQFEFDQTPTGTAGVGIMRWNDEDGTVDLGLKGGNVTLQIGQESVIRVVNKTATNITLLESNYQAVRVTGAQGNRLKVDLAQATTDSLSAETIGIVTETILNNQEGFITTNGLVRGINTTGSLQGETWVDGDMLYLSPTVAGQLTKVKPVAPNHLVIIGYVVRAHATQGQIFVKVDNGYELDELHNVDISGTLSNNQVLSYVSSTNVWQNRSIRELTDLQIRRGGYVIFEDFHTAQASGQGYFITTTLNGGTLATFSQASNPGIRRISSSATGNSGGSILLFNSSVPITAALAPGMQFDTILRLPASPVVTTVIRTGLIHGTNNNADAQNGNYFEITGNSLVGKTANTSTRSSTAALTLTPNTFYHLRTIYNSSSLNTFEVYDMSGTLVWSATLTTNINAGSVSIQPAHIALDSAGGTRTLIEVDYIGFTYPSYNSRGALT